MNRPSGQSLNDRLTAARYTIAGQGLARVVCKATTEELMAPKKKHLDCELRRVDTTQIIYLIIYFNFSSIYFHLP